MLYSIPSDISVVDINGDDLADQLYVGDMGAQIWRFDITNGATDAASLVTGGVIADFSRNPADGSHDAANNRRFYYAPDVALLNRDGTKYLSISVGSGWRAHPLDKVVEDKFYSIRDTNVYAAPSSYTTLYEYNASGASDLYDATDNLLGEGTDNGDGTGTKEVAAATLATKSGWLIRLENSGEKVLAESTTVNSQILFTTYQPEVSSGSTCSAGQGLGRLYAVSSFDATPVVDVDSSTTFTKSDRSINLVHGGIPPAPSVLYPKDSAPLVLVGTEIPVPDLNFGDLVVPTYWYEDTE
jgi:type IV pilus assembly protein PilY1